MRNIFIVICMLALSVAAQAQIIHVPGDYQTIQEGINAANPGDTVLVADGIYYEQINFLGKKPLTVASEFLTDGNTAHIDNTILDGSQLPNPDSATIVYFPQGCDTTSVLCGFTIRGGMGTYFTAPGITVRADGGIHIDLAGAKIVYNHITENHLSDTVGSHAQVVTGAGLGTRGDQSFDQWVVVDHNVIDHNSCYSTDVQASGAGMDIYFNARISNNQITHNTVTSVSPSSSLGVGICCANDPSWATLTTCIVEHNVITDNLSQCSGNWANSAGCFFQAVRGIFEDNVVARNEVVTWQYSGGVGGCYSFIPRQGSVYRNNTFTENKSNMWAGALGFETYTGDTAANQVLIENNYFLGNSSRNGGALITWDVPLWIQNNVFKGNHVTGVGGAVELYFNQTSEMVHHAVLANNTFSENKAGIRGGAIYSFNAKAVVFNSIFWNDSSKVDNGPEIYVSGLADTLELANSNIDINKINGRWRDGGGNIYEDPLFEFEDLLIPYHWSPCIDAGIAGYTCACGALHQAPSYDLWSLPRPIGLGYDMGAYEQEHWGVGVRPISNYKLLITNSPNPFGSYTTFNYMLDKPCQVTLQIYNGMGKPVSELVNTWQQKGEHRVTWDASGLPSGIYFYRIEAGSRVGSGKILKL